MTRKLLERIRTVGSEIKRELFEEEVANCENCEYRKDIAHSLSMFTNWICTLNNKGIRYDLINYVWIPIGFKCPIETTAVPEEFGKPVPKEPEKVIGAPSRQERTEREWRAKAHEGKAAFGQKTLSSGVAGSRRLGEFDVLAQEKASLLERISGAKSVRELRDINITGITIPVDIRYDVLQAHDKKLKELEAKKHTTIQPNVSTQEIIEKIERFRPISIEEADKLWVALLEPEGWRIDQPVSFEWWRIRQPEPEIFGISGTFETFREAVGHIIRKSRPAWLAAKGKSMEKPIIPQQPVKSMISEEQKKKLEVAKAKVESLLAEEARLDRELQEAQRLLEE